MKRNEQDQMTGNVVAFCLFFGGVMAWQACTAKPDPSPPKPDRVGVTVWVRP